MSQLSITNLSHGPSSDEIVLPANTYLQSSSSFAYRGPGSIIQRNYYALMPTAHVSTTSTSSITGIYGTINPTRASSRILVRFHSSIASGNANNRFVMQMLLFRRINNGSWLQITPYSNTTSRYQYGWTYVARSWTPLKIFYLDAPENNGTVQYAVNFFSRTATQLTYLCHTYMEMGIELTEIGQ